MGVGERCGGCRLMPFTARRHDGALVFTSEFIREFSSAGKLDASAARAALERRLYVCDDESCGRQLSLNRGNEEMRAHFKHLKGQACAHPGAGMSKEHLFAQRSMRKLLQDAHGDDAVVSLESNLVAETGKGRADIAVTSSDGSVRLCIEIQRSSMATLGVLTRQQQRRAAGYELEWVFIFPASAGGWWKAGCIQPRRYIKEVINERGYALALVDPLVEDLRLRVLVHPSLWRVMRTAKPAGHTAAVLPGSWQVAESRAVVSGLFHPDLMDRLRRGMEAQLEGLERRRPEIRQRADTELHAWKAGRARRELALEEAKRRVRAAESDKNLAVDRHDAALGAVERAGRACEKGQAALTTQDESWFGLGQFRRKKRKPLENNLAAAAATLATAQRAEMSARKRSASVHERVREANDQLDAANAALAHWEDQKALAVAKDDRSDETAVAEAHARLQRRRDQLSDWLARLPATRDRTE